MEVNFKKGKIDNALYRAVVVDNNDPKNLGRVKVRIYSLHGKEEVKDDDLPWASMCSPFGSANSGSFIIPEINNTVFCLLEGGDPYYPVYLGWAYSLGKEKPYYTGNTSGRKRYVKSAVNEKPYESNNNYIKTIYKSPKGSTLIMDDTDSNESVKLQDSSGQIIGMGCAMSETYTENNNHLKDGLLNVNMTKKNLSGLGFLRKPASIILKGLSSAFLKIISNGDGTSYIEQRVEETLLKLKSNGDFNLQTCCNGISYSNGTLTISAPTVDITALNVNISCNRIKIDGFLTINDVSIFPVHCCPSNPYIDINEGGNLGSYKVLKEEPIENTEL